MLEIIYENTFRDILAYNMRALFLKRTNWFIYAMGWLLIFYIVYSSETIEPGLEGFVVSLFSSCFMLCVMFGVNIVLVVVTCAMSSNRRSERGVLTTHKMTFTPEGYTEETPVNTTASKWEGVYNIKKDAKRIYLYESPGKAHIIPRRAFSSESDYFRFFRAICGLWKERKMA